MYNVIRKTLLALTRPRAVPDDQRLDDRRGHLIRTVTVALVLGLCGASVASAQTPNSVSNNLGQPCILTGNILSRRTGHDNYGAAVTGGGVTLISDGHEFGPRLQTDAVGHFTFFLYIGSYTLEVRAPGFNPKHIAVEVKPESDGVCVAQVTVELLPLGKLAPLLPSILDVYNNAVSQYCKKRPGTASASSMSCVFYMTHANVCLKEAFVSEQIYASILFREQQGLSEAQVLQSVGSFGISPSDAEVIAQGAATVIDGLNSKRKNAADDPKASEVFARVAVLPMCLKNIAQ